MNDFLHFLKMYVLFGLQKDFDDLAKQYENHPHVRFVLRYEETLTHNIYGAADIFVIPSIFEPCGLTQVGLLFLTYPPEYEFVLCFR